MDWLTVIVGGALVLDLILWVAEFAKANGKHNRQIALLERKVQWLEARVADAETDLMQQRDDIRDIEDDLDDVEDQADENKAELEAAFYVTKVIVSALLAVNEKVDSLDEATVAHIDDPNAHDDIPAWQAEDE